MTTPEAIGEDGHANCHLNQDILARSPRPQRVVVGARRIETTLHAAATRPSAEVLIYLGTPNGCAALSILVSRWNYYMPARMCPAGNLSSGSRITLNN